MAQITQVFIFSMLFLSIYGQYDITNQPQETQRISDVLSLSKLLQSAARLTYPITSGINNVVGRFVEPKNNLSPPNYYIFDSYEDISEDVPYERAHINRNIADGNRLQPDLQNQRRTNGQDVKRRHSCKPNSYYYYDTDYNTQLSQGYDHSSAFDEGFPFRNSKIQLKPESINSDNDVKSLSKIVEEVFNYKPAPESVAADESHNINDADFVPITPLAIPPHKVKNTESNSDKVILISATEATNSLYVPTVPNLENGDNYAIPLTNLNAQEPKLENEPAGVISALTNIDNAPENIFPTLDGVKPNIIYIILNPQGINSGMDISNPKKSLNNQGLKSNGDEASNTPNGYYVIPTYAESDVPNPKSPVVFIPANNNLVTNGPDDEITTDNISREN